MGGGIAGFFGRWMRLNPHDLRILLMAGIAAGFAAVFGTPVAGTVFAMEVIAIGSIKYDALLPCLVASIIAHITCTTWGIQHTVYTLSFNPSSSNGFLSIDLLLLGKVLLAGIAFGLAANLFAALQHGIKYQCNKFIQQKWAIPALGGVLIILLTLLAGTRDYIGLGVLAQNPGGISILSSFNEGGVNTWSWLWKLAFTVITLGTGFKGGEVTPLFFIGAALGNTIAFNTGAPIALFAALGFIAVFAGATNTPLACTIMGVELFGGDHILYFAVACFTAYYFSGHSGIYQSQRIGVAKIKTGNAFSFSNTFKQFSNRQQKHK
jgi:H+/Cl- antiporter ClcA